MLCDEFDSRLQHLMDSRRSPETDRALQVHAQICSSCREQLTASVRLLDGLEMLEVPPLPDDFAQQVVQRAVGVAPAPRGMSRRTLLVALTVAATLLVTMVPAYWLSSHRSPHNTARSPSLPHTTEKVALAPPSSEETAAADSSDLGWWMVPPESILELYSPEARARHRQQVQEIAHDLRPIATPFNAAMEAIYRTLPVGRSREKSPPRTSSAPPHRLRNWS